jgi:hypothetical protein
MSESTTTTVLAIWGAILSSFTLGWNLYRDFLQRGRLRVTCYIGQIFGDPTISQEKRLLIWNVTNVGKEPVVLTNIGGSIGETAFVVNTRDPLPRTLGPGDYFTGFSDDLSVLKQELEYLCAYDSLGRIFKASKKAVKELIRKFESGEYTKD